MAHLSETAISIQQLCFDSSFPVVTHYIISNSDSIFRQLAVLSAFNRSLSVVGMDMTKAD